jgi:hypothetical protein
VPSRAAQNAAVRSASTASIVTNRNLASAISLLPSPAPVAVARGGLRTRHGRPTGRRPFA